jgi:hypothetical protein
MAWTTPRTWTTGELVTAAIMNAHIRDNQNVLNPAGVSFHLDAGGAALTTGSKIPWAVPFSCTISQWDLFCDSPSSLAIEIYANSYGGILPASEDSINSGSPAFCASSASNRDTSPSAWGALAQGEQVLITVSSVNGITKGTLTLYLART